MSVLIGRPNGRLAFMLNSLSSYNIEIIIIIIIIDHCRRASRFQSRKEHHRTNIQSQDPLQKIPAASAESLTCLHRLQEGL